MKELTEQQKELLKVAQLSTSELPKTHKELHKMVWDAYEAGTKAIQAEAKVKPEKKNILMKLFGEHSQINMVSDTRYLSESDFINLIHDKSFPLDDSSVL